MRQAHAAAVVITCVGCTRSLSPAPAKVDGGATVMLHPQERSTATSQPQEAVGSLGLTERLDDARFRPFLPQHPAEFKESWKFAGGVVGRYNHCFVTDSGQGGRERFQRVATELGMRVSDDRFGTLLAETHAVK